VTYITKVYDISPAKHNRYFGGTVIVNYHARQQSTSGSRANLYTARQHFYLINQTFTVTSNIIIIHSQMTRCIRTRNTLAVNHAQKKTN